MLSSEVTKGIGVARRLASVYGQRLDAPVMYPHGVALSGRLRLAALEGTTAAVAEDVAGIVAATVHDPDSAFDERFGLAGLAAAVWADELFAATGESRYMDFLVAVAERFELDSGEAVAPPLDPDIRVEDFFFAGALLGRAYQLTGDERFTSTAARYLLAVDTQQADGLFWHCHASPYYWGRGNAFAALGFSELLTYLPPTDPSREELVARHVRHLEALRSFQDGSGMWRQVIDDPSTYLEHSATTMITCAIARGVRLGWLDASEWRPVIDRACDGIAERIGSGGELEHVCVGTGPLGSLAEYIDRPYTDGVDDRGGAMALWCAVEVERLVRGI